jgi:hypothetical protein
VTDYEQEQKQRNAEWIAQQIRSARWNALGLGLDPFSDADVQRILRLVAVYGIARSLNAEAASAVTLAFALTQQS